MPTGERRDPYRSFNFRLEIDGLTVGSFRECSGLSADGNVVEYREGTDIPRTARKLIGLQTYSNVTLKRGYTANTELWDWHYSFVEGRGRRRDGLIVLQNDLRQPVWIWQFKRGLPLKWSGPALHASQNNVAIEMLEIAHEGLVKA